MNIALVNPEYNTQSGIDHGGIATYTYNISNALAKKGHNLFLFLREGIVPEKLDKNITIISYNRSSLPLTKKIIYRLFNIDSWEEEFSYGLYKRVKSLHKEVSLDIIDIPEYNGLAAAFRGDKDLSIVLNFRTPRIIVDQYNNSPISAIDKHIYKLEERSVKVTKHYRTSSNALKDRISQLYKIPLNEISVIRNPVMLNNNTSENDNRSIKILFVGRLEPRKGSDLIIKSLSDILNISDNTEMHFAGEIKDDIKHKLLINVGKTQEARVKFHGPLGRENLQILYKGCDIFIFPSVFDNSPNALLEAMASSLPIIACDAPGVNEIIKDNENGLLFYQDHKDEFINKIKDLINNPDLRKRLSLNSYESAKVNFSPEKIAKETLNFYNSVLERNNI